MVLIFLKNKCKLAIFKKNRLHYDFRLLYDKFVQAPVAFRSNWNVSLNAIGIYMPQRILENAPHFRTCLTNKTLPQDIVAHIHHYRLYQTWIQEKRASRFFPNAWGEYTYRIFIENMGRAQRNKRSSRIHTRNREHWNEVCTFRLAMTWFVVRKEVICKGQNRKCGATTHFPPDIHVLVFMWSYLAVMLLQFVSISLYTRKILTWNIKRLIFFLRHNIFV